MRPRLLSWIIRPKEVQAMKTRVVIAAIGLPMILWFTSAGAGNPPKADETVGGLLKIVEDQKMMSSNTRIRAAHSLGAMGAKAETALPALLRLYDE